ncbi:MULTISPECIES: TlpA family protein disulfide reductase [Microbacterium]|uniref:Thioredoxin family protein n=1 Tax=Microbacterium marmarense TaxID=3122051 RepID=A0ABU8LVL9_9MICO
MNLVDVLIVIAALLALTTAVVAVLHWMQSRPRRSIDHEVIQPQRLGADALGDVATLLQFSTEAGARCPSVHKTLADVAADHVGVRHLDIDLTHRPDIARHFQVLQTPTTLVLDRDGAVQTRFGGTPGRHVLELELSRLGAEIPHA